MSDPILNPGAAHRLPRRFGKKPPRIDPRTLQFRKYLTAALPPLPASQNWGAAVPVVPGWGMDGNDTYGDCTIAAWAHADLLWTANANPPAWQPDVATIESTYFALTGGADTGLDMLTVLKFAQSTGMGGHKIGAFAQITTGNLEEMKQAIALGGLVYFGLDLPDYIANDSAIDPPWVLPPQDTTFPPPNPADGHCIILTAYDDASQTLTGITWGLPVVISYAFAETYGTESFFIISPDWFKPGGTSPPGLDSATLAADLALVQAETPSPNPPNPSVPWYIRFLDWLEALFHLGKKKSP